MMNSFCGLISGVVLVAGAGVAPAAVIDISHVGDSVTLGGAVFTSQFAAPTGSGSIGSILRVQNSPTEQGYNTNGGTPFDNKGGVSLNNGAVTLGTISSVTVNGTSYVGLLLDLDEPNDKSDPLLSMRELQVYVSTSGSQTTTAFNGDARTLPLGTLVYDLQPLLAAQGADGLLLADNFSGNGKSDYTVLLPASLFAAFPKGDFLTVYTKLGDSTNPTSGSFEEFGVISGTGGGVGAPVPEPASLGVLAMGAGSLLLLRRKR
jgi:hypothetical protein